MTKRGTKILAFIISYLCLSARRATLEGWSIMKANVQKTTGTTGAWLGAFDTFYLFAYAFGEIFTGGLSDKYSANRVVAVGLWGMSISLSAFSVFGYFQSPLPIIGMFLFAMNGLFQSSVYPGCNKIMAANFKAEIGKVMGLWCSNSGFGNILGALITSLSLSYLGFRWETIMLIICGLASLQGLLVWVTLPQRDDLLTEEMIRKKAPSLMEVLRMQGVFYYTMAYSCGKTMNYSIMMWLPLYMDSIGISTLNIGIIMMLYEATGVVGTFISGWISDAIHSRVIPLLVSTLISAPIVLGLNYVEGDLAFYIAGGVLGWTHVTISNMISGVVSIQLGKQNVGQVSGIIDGIASFFAGIGMFFIGFIYAYCWGYVWTSVFVVNLLAVVPLMLIRGRQTSQSDIQLEES